MTLLFTSTPCKTCSVQEELQDLREDLCEALIALRLNNRMMILKVLSKHFRLEKAPPLSGRGVSKTTN